MSDSLISDAIQGTLDHSGEAALRSSSEFGVQPNQPLSVAMTLQWLQPKTVSAVYGSGTGRQETEAQFEYNRFTRTWRHAHPEGTREELLAAWWSYRKQPITRSRRNLAQYAEVMPDQSPPPARPLWASVADGFYVGSRDGSFLGYVDRQADGTWRAFDAASRAVGDYADHNQAMAAVTSIVAVGAYAGETETQQGDVG